MQGHKDGEVMVRIKGLNTGMEYDKTASVTKSFKKYIGNLSGSNLKTLAKKLEDSAYKMERRSRLWQQSTPSLRKSKLRDQLKDAILSGKGISRARANLKDQTRRASKKYIRSEDRWKKTLREYIRLRSQIDPVYKASKKARTVTALGAGAVGATGLAYLIGRKKKEKKR